MYVDKTQHVHKLAERGGYYFLSRPRRFGKSLLISALYYLFKGQKNFFDRLYIADKWEFQEYPIIHIPFSKIGYREIGLERALEKVLDEIALQYELDLHTTTASQKFKELIQALATKYQQQVVILIDEYDKPIIDYLDKDKLHQAQENRCILKSFYSVLKDADAYLKLFFMTGMTKFCHVSLCPELNNLYDLTLLAEYNEICGISQADLEHYFPQVLQTYDKERIREWYNGYRWNETCDTVYNPYSLLKFFSSNGKFRNYWYTTGTPSFLLSLSRDLGWYDVSGTELSQIGMSAFSIERLQLLPLLFQTGYLTISGYDDIFNSYYLDYPNHEVKSAYLEGLLEYYSFNPEPSTPRTLSRSSLGADC